jgi:IS5 family transposase
MYTSEKSEKQYSFSADWFMPPELNQDHFLVKLTLKLDWEELSSALAKFYCPDNGRPTKPTRVKIGLMIVKHLYTLSDAEAVDMLVRDVYIQYLCDISLRQARDFMNPSTLCRFRKDIGEEGTQLIEQTIFRTIGKSRKRHSRTLITDTTVVPSCIEYPTDINLLDKTRRKAVGLLTEAKSFGARAVRTYKRVARKVFITYQKIRKHTVKSRHKAQKKLRQFARRNVQQLRETVNALKKTAANTADKTCHKFLKAAEKFLPTAEKIIEQQSLIYRKQKVKERIVSLHRPDIRPMVRGKYPIEVEFGPKVLLNLQDGFLTLERTDFENTADNKLFQASLNGYRERFGRLPSELSADRGFWSKENQALAESLGIKKIAIENKGKSSHLKGKPFRERLRRRRCAIEAKISLAKRKYGLDHCRYTRPGSEITWTRMGLLSMNLKAALSTA